MIETLFTCTYNMWKPFDYNTTLVQVENRFGHSESRFLHSLGFSSCDTAFSSDRNAM